MKRMAKRSLNVKAMHASLIIAAFAWSASLAGSMLNAHSFPPATSRSGSNRQEVKIRLGVALPQTKGNLRLGEDVANELVRQMTGGTRVEVIKIEKILNEGNAKEVAGQKGCHYILLSSVSLDHDEAHRGPYEIPLQRAGSKYRTKV